MAARTHTTRFRIEGMHCASCVARTESAIRQLPGVIDVAVNLATEEARVEHAAEAIPDVPLAVAPLGYRATRLDEAIAWQESADLSFEWRRDVRTGWLLAVAVAALVLLPLAPGELFVREAVMGVLAAVVLGVAGGDFFARAARALWHGHLDMDVLVALGTGAAFGAGVWSMVQTAQHGFHGVRETSVTSCGSEFLAAALIVFFVWIGRRLEARARRKASNAIDRLLNLQAPTAHVLRASSDLLASEQEIEVPVEQVQIGDVVLVRAGERVPVDGVVLAGVTEIDESSFTGEALPVRKQPGDKVLGGSVNQSGSFRFRAERVGDEMTLRRIAALVRDAQGSKAPIARLADRVAGLFVPLVLLIAAVTFFWWLSNADAHTAVSRAVAVLVVACPCALGLATPTAVMVAMGKGAELGVLFKDGAALEQTASLQIALFDKTGTLTEGRPEIVEVVPAVGVSREELLQTAATIASGSNHPLARAVVTFARRQSVPLTATPEHVHSEPGLGLEAVIDGETARLGSERWIRRSGALPQSELPAVSNSNVKNVAEHESPSAEALGRTPLFVARGPRLLGTLFVEDPLRSTATEATLALRQLGLDTGLVSGDRLAVARNVASKLGLSIIEAERLPSEKVDVVRSLQAAGRKVGMIGDGVNDAPALASADVGFAIGAGADVAIEAADVTLVGSDPRAVPHAIQLARRTLTIIRQNLFFAFAYNLVSIPLAAGLLSEFGNIILPPGFAAAAMSASSVLVVTNSLRLRRFKPHFPC